MKERRKGQAGFSLLELMVALGVTLVVMTVAGRILAMSLKVRTRENQRAEAIADAQRSLQLMTRDISNAGLGLSTNGLIDDDPNEDTFGELRVRSNLNAFTETTPDTADTDEDVVYSLIANGTVDPPQSLITRQDLNTGQITQIANRIDALQFTFLKADGTAAASVAAAEKVRITVTVLLQAVGTAGMEGYQPATRMQLVSEATLRNRLLTD
jgi:prepilin-type N-terminal cleavage/methylation domain-containing protein